ncbi:hypothetical protein [Mucilaginibacter arboris]|uniref:Uncharacterized protein n=1 Tax=Mucilaginibacter arboris TaxID=2682090 RepID=A0A7K1SVS1_9SPHI|nr:hypothetical protein [Mucilaginibacter arboris]MVN21432.1 hypothetical protein [Mucilaginibacter arboris]
MMINQTVEVQAKVYVYDLNNCAKEFGFKPDESWELNLATNEEKLAIEKDYYPTISAKVLPEILSELFGLVKAKLSLAKTHTENKSDVKAVSESPLNYLIAFNPKRLR